MPVGPNPIRQPVALLIAALCAVALVLIIVIAGKPNGGDANGRVIGVTLVVTVFTLCGFAGWTLGRRDHGTAGLIGQMTLVLSVLAFLAALRAIIDFDPFSGSNEALKFVAILALAAGQASAILATAQPDDPGELRVVRGLTALAVAALGLMVTEEIVTPGDQFVGPKAFGIVSVLYLLGLACLPLLRHLRVGETRGPAS